MANRSTLSGSESGINFMYQLYEGNWKDFELQEICGMRI